MVKSSSDRSGYIVPNSAPFLPMRDPSTAAMLSLVPGLGQLYNGQSRKGILFIDVALLNFVLIALVAFAEPIIKGLAAPESGHHVAVNGALLSALHSARPGSPFSIAVAVLCLAFVAYAVRDAYDTASFISRKQIYADAFIEMSEAASGSYLFHGASIVAVAILAMFFLVPQVPRDQVIQFEFLAAPNQKTPVKPTHVRAAQDSQASGKPREGPPKMPSAASSQSRSAMAAQASRKPAPPLAHPTAEQPTKPVPIVPKPLVARSVMPPHPMPNPLARPNTSLLPQPTVNLSQEQAATAVPKPLLPLSRAGASSNPQPRPLPATAQVQSMSTFKQPLPLNRASTISLASAFVPKPVATAAFAVAGSGTPLPQLPAAATVASHHSSGSTIGMPAPIRSSTRATGPVSGMAIPVGSASDLPRPRTTGSSGPATNGVNAGPHGASSNSSPTSDFTGEHARDGRESGLDAKHDPDFSRYMADLQRKIRSCWYPPRDPRSRMVKLLFKISRTGELSDLRLSTSCGSASGDKAALEAVRNAAPFRHLPDGSPPDVDIEFSFDYHVFGGGSATGTTRF